MKNYKIWIFAIFLLPLISISPYFHPPDWSKAIILRIITTIIILGILKSWLTERTSFNIVSLAKNPIFLVLCLQLGVFLLSSIFSIDPFSSFWGSPHRGGGFLNFFFFNIFAALIFLIFQKSNSLEWKKLFEFNLIIALLICLIAFLQLVGASEILLQRPGSTLGNPIYLGIYLLLLLFPAFSFFIEEKNKTKKYFYAALCLIFLATLFITQSRAAWLGVLLGGFYFLITYPSRNLPLNSSSVKQFKIIALLIFIISSIIVAYANISGNQALSRLSVSSLAQEGRFSAWKSVIPAIFEKPFLGWGYENFSISFDAYYNPANISGDWWDKSHNIFLDLLIETGILGFLAHVAVFVVLFWQLSKIKKSENEESQLLAHAIQASLIGYLIAIFFSFNSFATYLIFFFFIAWTIAQTTQNQNEIFKNPFSTLLSRTVFGLISFLFLIFIWQYNVLPFLQNVKINTLLGKCENEELKEFNNIALNSKILSTYASINYTENLQSCLNQNQLENANAIKESMPTIEQAVKKQPHYTRLWIILAKFSTILASQEENTQVKQEFFGKASDYLAKAKELSPLRPEIALEKSRIEYAQQNYPAMLKEAQNCIDLEPLTSPLACYFAKGIANIYLKNIEQAKRDIELSGHYATSIESKRQLINTWLDIEEYEEIIPLYEALIKKNPEDISYLASLAETYRQTGQYQKARETALKILEYSPASKPQVDAFLNLLP